MKFSEFGPELLAMRSWLLTVSTLGLAILIPEATPDCFAS
jgi:hypothetical protein